MLVAMGQDEEPEFFKPATAKEMVKTSKSLTFIPSLKLTDYSSAPDVS
jgi:hypothetical protein